MDFKDESVRDNELTKSWPPSQHLLFKSQLWKHQNKVWDLLIVNNNEDSKRRQWRRSVVSIVNFEQISHIISGVSIATLNR